MTDILQRIEKCRHFAGGVHPDLSVKEYKDAILCNIHVVSWFSKSISAALILVQARFKSRQAKSMERE